MPFRCMETAAALTCPRACPFTTPCVGNAKLPVRRPNLPPPALARSQLRACATLLRVKANVFSCKGMEFFCAKLTFAFAQFPATHPQNDFVSFGRKSIHRQGQPCRKARGCKVRYDWGEHLLCIKKPPQTRVWHYGQELSGLQLSVIRAVVKRSQSRTLDSFRHEDMHFGGKPEKSAAFCLMVV